MKLRTTQTGPWVAPVLKPDGDARDCLVAWRIRGSFPVPIAPRGATARRSADVAVYRPVLVLVEFLPDSRLLGLLPIVQARFASMLARSGLKLGHHRSSQPTKFPAINLKTAKALRSDK